MKKLITTQMAILIMLGFGQSLLAQKSVTPPQTENSNKAWFAYVFPQDSIAGFDESAASQNALARQCFGTEYQIFMYLQKREYVKNKYNIQSPVVTNPNSNTNWINAKPIISPTNQINAAPCVNEDFEASPSTALSTAAAAINNTLAGWQTTSGNTTQQPYNNCNAQNNANNAGCTFAWVRTTPWATPANTNLGNINASPFGGTKVLQMSDNLAGGKAFAFNKLFR